MQFSAHIRPHSTIDRHWKRHARRGGTVGGVVFAHDGKHFFADGLTPGQIAELEHIPSVQLECYGVAPASVEDIDELLCAKRGRGRPRKDASGQ